MTRFKCPTLCAGSLCAGSLCASALVLAFTSRAWAVGDVLIVAPHPDDEVIGCAGVILRAVEEKRRATVVVLTSGDAHAALTAAVAKKEARALTPEDFLQAGALRQGHSVSALKRLGVPRDDLMFLGYPDGGLEKMWQLDGSEVFQQRLTQQRQTYGLTARDYHSLAHGQAAPYVKASVVADLEEIIRARQPQEIYVSHESDKHPDHRTAFWLAREAARRAVFSGRFFAYVVHGEALPREPDLRLKLTPQEHKTKEAALLDHTQGTSPVHDGLVREYLKPEEPFWEFSILGKPWINSLGMKFVALPGTQVQMCIHETRRADYARYVAENPNADASWKDAKLGSRSASAGDDHPVVNVSWDDATAFCEWLSKQEGRRYRLPTDREWSIAVGIGNQEPAGGVTPESLSGKVPGVYPWGRQWPPTQGAGNYADEECKTQFPEEKIVAGYADGFAITSPVMSFPPNELEIYDLGGSVWEWCGDWFNAENKDHVLRGASWGSSAQQPLLSSFRANQSSTRRWRCDGFRCVVEATATR